MILEPSPARCEPSAVDCRRLEPVVIAEAGAAVDNWRLIISRRRWRSSGGRAADVAVAVDDRAGAAGLGARCAIDAGRRGRGVAAGTGEGTAEASAGPGLPQTSQ